MFTEYIVQIIVTREENILCMCLVLKSKFYWSLLLLLHCPLKNIALRNANKLEKWRNFTQA